MTPEAAGNDVERIAAVLFSHSGETAAALDHLLAPLRDGADTRVDVVRLEPQEPYPWPWGPAIVQYVGHVMLEQDRPVLPVDLEPVRDADLVILASPIWFQSAPPPVRTFLDAASTQAAFDGKPVLILTTCRKFWNDGTSRMRSAIERAGGSVVGVIALTDPWPTAASLKATARFQGTGRKAADALAPRSGVAEADLVALARWAPALRTAARLKTATPPELFADGARLDPRDARYQARSREVLLSIARKVEAAGPFGAPERGAVMRRASPQLLWRETLLYPALKLLWRLAPRTAGTSR